MDNYGVIQIGEVAASIPGAILWLLFVSFFMAVADRAQTKSGAIIAFLVMTGAFTAFLLNMGWFFVVGN